MCAVFDKKEVMPFDERHDSLHIARDTAIVDDNENFSPRGDEGFNAIARYVGVVFLAISEFQGSAS
jgi:hypothetical protein